jgi:hypothetical protein
MRPDAPAALFELLPIVAKLPSRLVTLGRSVGELLPNVAGLTPDNAETAAREASLHVGPILGFAVRGVMVFDADAQADLAAFVARVITRAVQAGVLDDARRGLPLVMVPFVWQLAPFAWTIFRMVQDAAGDGELTADEAERIAREASASIGGALTIRSGDHVLVDEDARADAAAAIARLLNGVHHALRA